MYCAMHIFSAIFWLFHKTKAYKQREHPYNKRAIRSQVAGKLAFNHAGYIQSVCCCSCKSTLFFLVSRTFLIPFSCLEYTIFSSGIQLNFKVQLGQTSFLWRLSQGKLLNLKLESNLRWEITHLINLNLCINVPFSTNWYWILNMYIWRDKKC